MKWYRRLVSKHSVSPKYPPFILKATIDKDQITYIEDHRALCLTFAIPSVGILLLVLPSAPSHNFANVTSTAVLIGFCLIGFFFGFLALAFAGAKRVLVIDRHQVSISFWFFGHVIESVQAPLAEVVCMKQMCWVNTSRVQSVMVRVLVRIDSDFFCIAMHNDASLLGKHVMVLEAFGDIPIVSGPPVELDPKG